MPNPLQELFPKGGVSVWYDSLSREMVKSGALQKMIAEDGLRGQTSNPSIFQSSISKGKDYDQQSLDLAKQGKSIIMISSELPEVLGMSDRVYVVSSGRISVELLIEDATQEKIMQLATN